jgi:hypothetical protein
MHENFVFVHHERRAHSSHFLIILTTQNKAQATFEIIAEGYLCYLEFIRD